MRAVKATSLIGSLLLGAVVTTVSLPAMSAVTKNQALTVCTDKIESTYGDSAITKLKRIKKRKSYKVQLFVSGVSDSRFVAECEVDKDSGEVASLDPAVAP